MIRGAHYSRSSGEDTIYGGDGNDTLYSAAGSYEYLANWLYGEAGNDTLNGSRGNDTLDGGTGVNIIMGGDGHDNIYGNSGNDTLNGGDGDDVLYGDSGDDNLYGDAGADTFKFTVGGGVDVIKDFSLSEGDVLDIVNLLSGYDPFTSNIIDFVQITTSGANSIVKIDANGLTGGAAWTTVATLEGITGMTDEAALVSSGNLVAA